LTSLAGYYRIWTTGAPFRSVRNPMPPTLQKRRTAAHDAHAHQGKPEDQPLFVSAERAPPGVRELLA